MARYSRRTGPAANFELTAAFQTIPGISITRFFDAGELLIAYRVRFFNGTGANNSVSTDVLVDGQSAVVNPPATHIINDGRGTLGETIIFPISEGIHTIEVQALGVAAAGDEAVINGSQLTVIQLPQWDRDTDIL